jgi:hypothetical protein
MSVLAGIGEFWKIQLDKQLNLANATVIAADVTFIASEWPWSEPNTWLNVHKTALQDHTNWALG